MFFRMVILLIKFVTKWIMWKYWTAIAKIAYMAKIQKQSLADTVKKQWFVYNYIMLHLWCTEEAKDSVGSTILKTIPASSSGDTFIEDQIHILLAEDCTLGSQKIVFFNCFIQRSVF